MPKTKILLFLSLLCALGGIHAQAQIQTNLISPPATILENIESTTGQVLIKATMPSGSLNLNGAIVNVVCKEDVLPATGHKEHGLYIGVSVNNQPEIRTVIDFDELDSLIGALDYLNAVNWSITALSSFNASYTTKAGLRLAAYSSKRSGQIEFSVRNTRIDLFDLKLSPEQRSEFRAVLDQARTKLIALRNG